MSSIVFIKPKDGTLDVEGRLTVNGELVETNIPWNPWKKYTFETKHLTGITNSTSITIFSLPKGNEIEEVVLKHNHPFNASGSTFYKVSVGIQGDLEKFASAFDVYQPVSGTTFQKTSNSYGLLDMDNDTDILLTASSDIPMSAASGSGSVNVWIKTRDILR